jgi:hypothetical protein
MGATYTRQSTYTDGDVIQASDTNNEFNQLLAAFAASTGHTHDGTTAEGGPITKLLGNALTFGAGTAGTDITVTFDGESNDGVLKWMEDEDYFEFSDDILVASTEKLQFRDTAIYINSSTDGQLDLVADTEIQIAATTIDMNGAADISGNLGVGGNLTVTGNIVIGSADINETELEILDGLTVTTAEVNILDGDTSATSTTVADADRVVLNDNGTMKQVAVTDLSAYFDDEITAMPNLVSTGALDSGSITSGFGNIDTGSSTITTAGLITGGSLVVDNFTLNGTELDLSSGDFTLDVAGNILLDADGGTVKIADNGTNILQFANVSSDAVIQSLVSDKDIIFKGQDSGSTVTAMRIDADGNVGIGDTSPESNTNYKALTVTSTSGNGGGQVYVQSSSVNSVFGAFVTVTPAITVLSAVPLTVIASASSVPSTSTLPETSSDPASNSPVRVIFLKPVISLFVSTTAAFDADIVPAVISSIDSRSFSLILAEPIIKPVAVTVELNVAAPELLILMASDALTLKAIALSLLI